MFVTRRLQSLKGDLGGIGVEGLDGVMELWNSVEGG